MERKVQERKDKMAKFRITNYLMDAMSKIVEDSPQTLSWHFRQALIHYIFLKRPELLPPNIKRFYERNKQQHD